MVPSAKPNFFLAFKASRRLVDHSSLLGPRSDGLEMRVPELSPAVRTYGEIVRLVRADFVVVVSAHFGSIISKQKRQKHKQIVADRAVPESMSQIL